PELIRTSLERAGLADVWNGRLFPATTGDGYARTRQTAVAGYVGYSTPETCWTTRTTWQE
ncbi:hypothetical protein ACWC94_38595, partial [Streptomyces sp. NPDC001135]